MKIYCELKPVRSDKDGVAQTLQVLLLGNYYDKITIEKIKNLNFGNKTIDE
jgi:hypothetical protein